MPCDLGEWGGSVIPVSVWVVSHQKEEWRLPRGVTGPIFMCKLCHWKISDPVILLVISYKAQEVSTHWLVHSDCPSV